MVNKASRARVDKTAKKKKSGFVYKPRKYEDVKRRAEKPSSRFDSYFKSGLDTFRPKVGENVIRILPPTWEDSHEHYGYTIWVHSWVGPDKSTYLCPAKMKKKACPICEAAEAARKAGEDDEYKALNVREQTVFWIIDRDDDDQQPLLYAVSGQMDRDILAQTIASRTGKAIMIDHPDDGYDVFIKRTGQGLKTRYVCSIDRDPSPIADKESEQDEIMQYVQDNPIPSTLKFYNEEYLSRIVDGTGEQKDEDTEDEDEDTDEEEERPRGRRGAKTADDDEPEEEDDTEEDEEERPTRVKRRKVGKAEEDEGEDDEEDDDDADDDASDDEEEEAPRRKTKPVARTRRRKDDDDEDQDELPFDKDDDEDEEEPPRRPAVKKRSRR